MILWFLSRPVTVLMLCLTIVVLGVLAVIRIPLQLLPDFERPILKVILQFPGSTAPEMDSEITEPVERALSTLPKLKEITSHSEPGYGDIRLEFRQGTSLKEILPLVKDRLDLVALPEQARKPYIQKELGNSGPLFSFLIGINPHIDSRELGAEIKRTLLRPLENLDGVALVNVLGLPTQTLDIDVDAQAVLGRGIQLQELGASLVQRTRWQALGSVTDSDRSLMVKLGSPFESLADLMSTAAIAVGPKVTRISDIAKSEVKVAPPNNWVYLGKNPALLIEVFREAEANAVEVGKRVRELVSQYHSASKTQGKTAQKNDQTPQVTTLNDQGFEIEEAIANIKNTVTIGSLLAAVVIYILVQIAWPSFVVTLTIPLSLLATFVLMSLLGVSFNVMSLAGIAIGVGMLVDNSTVVLESIQMQRKRMTDPLQAALFGTKRVAAAITASTLSTIAVFAPLAFIEGSIGLYFRDIAKTVCLSLICSLLISMVVVPLLTVRQLPKAILPGTLKLRSPIDLLGAYQRIRNWWSTLLLYLSFSLWVSYCIAQSFSWLRHFAASWTLLAAARFEENRLKPLLAISNQYLVQFEKWLFEKIQLGLKRRKQTAMWAAVLVGLGVIGLYNQGSELFPNEATDRVEYQLEFPPGANDQIIERKLKGIQAEVEKLEGANNQITVTGWGARHKVRYIIQSEVKRLPEIVESSQRILAQVPDLRFDKKVQSLVASSAPILAEIYSEKPVALQQALAIAESEMKSMSELTDVQPLERFPTTEIRLDVDRQSLVHYGIDTSGFARVIKDLLSPKSLGLFSINGESIPTQIQVSSHPINSAAALAQVSIDIDDSKKIFLSEVAKIIEQQTVSQIYRRDRQPVSIIQANLASTSLGETAARLQARLKETLANLPVRFSIAGQNQDRIDNLKQLSLAFLFSIMIIYVLLASQFEDLRQPLIILCAVPFCALGIAAFLAIFNLHISATVMVGCILLVGMSVNTSIIIVDLANQLRLEGRSAQQAIVESTITRTRPILVTTAANILGMVPMLFTGSEPGGSLQVPMAATLIGGLISSTLLTILILPVVYLFFSKGAGKHLESVA